MFTLSLSESLEKNEDMQQKKTSQMVKLVVINQLK